MQVLHRRPDGSFVALVRGLPYHVVQSDPLFAAVAAAAAGLSLPPEPEPISVDTPPRALTPREFMDRLSQVRQAEITAAAMASPALLLWLIRLSSAVEVDPAHPETIAGVNALRAAGAITQVEAGALLAPV